MGQNSVLIIGAGMAGLAAAYELSKASAAVTLLEGRDRLGGRIHTVKGRGGLPLELGAEFVHGENVATWAYIRRAGLATHQVPDTRWFEQDGQLTKDSSFDSELESLVAKVDKNAPDQSFAEFLERTPGLSGANRSRIREYVEGFHAADLNRISVRAVARAERAAENIEGTKQFRLTAGYGALIDWFKSQLRTSAVPVHCGCVVERVRWQPGQVEVQAETSSGSRDFTASRAIVTLPVELLKANGGCSITFEPEVPQITRALSALEMGHVTKLVLEFHSQFWPEANFGFIHSREHALPTWWADERGPILTAWAGGPRAKRQNSQKLGLLADVAVRTLARLFATAKETVADLLMGIVTHNWSDDPFSRGAYSYGVGGADAPRHLAEPIARTLFFAGEATATDAQQGTVHGALASGRKAAEEILRQSGT